MTLFALLLVACTADKTPSDSTPPDDTGVPDETGETGGPDETGETADGLLAEVMEVLQPSLESDLTRNRAAGVSVAVWMDDTIVAFGLGERHPTDGGEITPDTLFQIGSDTKKMTAIAVLQRVAEGSLSLDDTLATALPELRFAKDPSWSERITVHHLLSHQGGLFDYTPWDDAPEDAELAERAYGRFADNEWAMAPGGVFWNYCNPGFSLAGLITEEADGRAWADILSEDLYAPLGMDRTFGRLTEVVADGDYATGRGVIVISGGDSFDFWGTDAEYEMGVLEMEDQLDNGFTRPAGLVWSTATDQMKLARFLVDGDERVLPDALREQISTAQVHLSPIAEDQSYGYGLMVLDGLRLGDGYYEVPLWAHGGNTLTMTSAFYVLPEQRFGISILSNSYGDDFSETVAEAIAAFADLPAPSEAPSYPEPEDLESYAGTWVDEYGLGEITLTWDGEDVLIDIPALTEAGYTVRGTLTPVVKDVFYAYIDNVPYDLTFVDGEDGTPHKYMRNRLFVGVQEDDGDSARHARRPLDRAAIDARLAAARLSWSETHRWPSPFRPLPSPSRSASRAPSGG